MGRKAADSLRARSEAVKAKLRKNIAALVVNIRKGGKIVSQERFTDPREAFVALFNKRCAKYGLSAEVA